METKDAILIEYYYDLLDSGFVYIKPPKKIWQLPESVCSHLEKNESFTLRYSNLQAPAEICIFAVEKRGETDFFLISDVQAKLDWWPFVLLGSDGPVIKFDKRLNPLTNKALHYVYDELNTYFNLKFRINLGKPFAAVHNYDHKIWLGPGEALVSTRDAVKGGFWRDYIQVTSAEDFRLLQECLKKSRDNRMRKENSASIAQLLSTAESSYVQNQLGLIKEEGDDEKEFEEYPIPDWYYNNAETD